MSISVPSKKRVQKWLDKSVRVLKLQWQCCHGNTGIRTGVEDALALVFHFASLQLVNNLSDSTVLIYHWNSVDVVVLCGVVRCDSLQVFWINLMERFSRSPYGGFFVQNIWINMLTLAHCKQTPATVLYSICSDTSYFNWSLYLPWTYLKKQCIFIQI